MRITQTIRAAKKEATSNGYSPVIVQNKDITLPALHSHKNSIGSDLQSGLHRNEMNPNKIIGGKKSIGSPDPPATTKVEALVVNKHRSIGETGRAGRNLKLIQTEQ